MAEKANPFAKLGAQSAPASKAKSTKAKDAAASEDVDSAEEASEEEVVEAAKQRVAAKRATRTVKAKAEPEPEEDEAEEEADSAEDSEGEDEKAVEPEEDEAAEPVKPAAKSTRRTAKQVEEEYQAKQAELEAQIAKLIARIEGGDVGGGVEVVKDRVVLEDGEGGDLRVVGASRTLVNDDWRATVTDGIKLVVGRSSAQATNSFVIPVSLAKSLGELLAEIDEIAE